MRWDALPVVLRHRLEEKRSKSHVVRDALGVNDWLRAPPTVDGARPKVCVECGAGGRPIGAPLLIHGHGVRERQVRGPLAFTTASVTVTVVVRRYQCQPCGAVMTVVPRELMPGLLYSACAIGLAIALYGLCGRNMGEVRTAVSAWSRIGDDATGWPSLRRWIEGASALWASVRSMPGAFEQQQQAERVASTLAGHASSYDPIEFAAFVGAALAR